MDGSQKARDLPVGGAEVSTGHVGDMKRTLQSGIIEAGDGSRGHSPDN